MQYEPKMLKSGSICWIRAASRRMNSVQKLGATLAACAIIAVPGNSLSTTPNPSTTSATVQTNWMMESGAEWVWPADAAAAPNQYVELVQNFEAPATTTAAIELAISADTDYAVWINGQLAGFGQWSNYPNDKTFDTLDVSKWTHAGSNHIAVLAWWQGESSSQYRKGAPGVVFAVRAGEKIIAHSGATSQIRKSPEYISGRVPKVTGQLSYTFEHQAQNDDGWRAADYVPGSQWHKPLPDELRAISTRPVRPRPIPKLLLGDRIPMRVHSQGVFLRKDQQSSPAIAMQSDFLSVRLPGKLFDHPRPTLTGASGNDLTIQPAALKDSTGAYIVLDCGREEAGLLDLEVNAPAGTTIDIAYGEHLEDMRVRATVGGRQFGVRHVCGTGKQSFLHPFLRLAGRYLQLHITPAPTETTAPITLHYAGIRPTDYPVTHTGTFVSSDSLHNQIWEVSKRTLHLCMHEHYEDCPWREQSLYGMDMRNQALAGYYCFGNYDFAAASFDLLGKGLAKDGFLELCAPAEIPITIPSFSLAWILCLDDHLLYSGNREFCKSQLGTAEKVLQTCAKLTTGPLVSTPQGKRMWNFYEWAPGLDGSDRTGFQNLQQKRFDAPLNLFHLLAVDGYVRMAKECGVPAGDFQALAAQLRAAFHSAFWDAERHAYRTYLGEGQQPHFAELTQSLAILAGVVPQSDLPALRKRLASDNNGLVACTISHMLYKFEALMTDKHQYGARVFDLIKQNWGYMLNQGATSFWETIDGAAAFDNAGSLCHGWSGIPAYFYGAYALGVRPTAPGFQTTDQDPLTTILPAKGKVPTPTSTIQID